MKNQRVLISGAGIAGLTLAFWLKKYGFRPTILEQAPHLREGGYLIDFFGVGYDVAEKMNIMKDLEKVNVKMPEITFVDDKGKRKGGLNPEKILSLLNGRAFNLLRSDLARVIYEHLDKNVEFIFGTSIARIEQDPQETRVIFKNGTLRFFDLVIGADGLHSNVRSLIFGNESQFEKYYGFYASSFTIDNFLPAKNVFLSYTIPGKQVNVYSLPGNRLATLFLFSSPQKLRYDHHDTAAQKQILRDEFQSAGWECVQILERLDQAPDFYFDPVSQIQMSDWSAGRVSLVGDASDCPSLLSGQGSTLAMTGAYILAGELKIAEGNYRVAFAEYERIFRPFIAGKQRLAQKFASSFVPKSRLALWLRNTMTNLMFLPIFSKWLVRQFMTDKLTLKSYEEENRN